MLLQAVAPLPDPTQGALSWARTLLAMAEQHRGRAVLALILVGLVALLRVVVPKLHDKVGKWFSTDLGAVVLTIATSLTSALAMTLWAGNKITWQLAGSAAEVAFLAAGGWSMVTRLIPASWREVLAKIVPPNPPVTGVAAPLDISGVVPQKKEGGFVVVSLLMAVAGLTLLGLILGGCAYCKQATNASTPICKVAQVAKQCGEPEVVKLVLQYLPQVVAALLSGDYASLLTSLESDLAKLGITDGSTVISCAVSVADSNSKPPGGAAVPPFLLVLHEHATAWLASHPVK